VRESERRKGAGVRVSWAGEKEQAGPRREKEKEKTRPLGWAAREGEGKEKRPGWAGLQGEKERKKKRGSGPGPIRKRGRKRISLKCI
jgi:hypothetical protein